MTAVTSAVKEGKESVVGKIEFLWQLFLFICNGTSRHAQQDCGWNQHSRRLCFGQANLLAEHMLHALTRS